MRRSGHVALACALMFGAGVSTATAATPTPTSAQITKAVKSAYTTFARSNFVPGMAIAVISADRHRKLTTHYFPYGVSNLKSRRAVTLDTQFEIGSESKVFTAAILQRAVEHRKVRLSDGVQRFLPAGSAVPTRCGRSFTFAELGTHRSGLPRRPGNYGPTPADHAGYTQSELFSALGTTKLGHCPGGHWLYSNFGFGLLGTVVARAEHSTYGKLVDQVVARPLGMRATYLERATSRLATGYCKTKKVAPRWDNTGALAGGGGLISSARDMATFVRAQLGTGPTSVVRTLRATQTSLAPGNMPNFTMGLGWQLYKKTGIPGTYLFKNGGTNGMHSATVLVPAARLGVTVLSNGPHPPNAVSATVVAKLLGAPGPSASDGDDSGC